MKATRNAFPKSKPSAPSRASAPVLAGPTPADAEAMLQILTAMVAFRQGDFAARLPVAWGGVPGRIAEAFNDVLLMTERSAAETARVCRTVGKEGRQKVRLQGPAITGGWN